MIVKKKIRISFVSTVILALLGMNLTVLADQKLRTYTIELINDSAVPVKVTPTVAYDADSVFPSSPVTLAPRSSQSVLWRVKIKHGYRNLYGRTRYYTTLVLAYSDEAYHQIGTVELGAWLDSNLMMWPNANPSLFPNPENVTANIHTGARVTELHFSQRN